MTHHSKGLAVAGAWRSLAVAALLAGASLAGIAQAATVDTRGGLKLKSDDGQFEFNVGGRIHLDLDLVSEDDDAVFGSALNPASSSPLFRRARLTFSGKAFGWEYMFTPDFAQSSGGNLRTISCLSTPCTVNTSGVAFQELYVARALGSGKLYIGQFTPFRSIEDNTSSNELTLMERAYTGSMGVYRGGVSRLFQMGLGYQMNPTPQTTLGTAVFSLRKDDTPATEGVGATLRTTWAPVLAERRVLHLGLSGSVENPQGDGSSGNVGTVVSYAGIRGPTANLGQTTGGGKAQYLAGELAGVYGPFHLQSEITQARYDQDELQPVDRSTTLLYHVTVSYALTGESRPYDTRRGSFRSVVPRSGRGALEVALRHESARNQDAVSPTAVETVSTDTLGLTWTLNPHVRVMANYLLGKAERVDGQRDEPSALTLRFQMNW